MNKRNTSGTFWKEIDYWYFTEKHSVSKTQPMGHSHLPPMLYGTQARNVFHILNGWEKNQRNNNISYFEIWKLDEIQTSVSINNVW